LLTLLLFLLCPFFQDQSPVGYVRLIVDGICQSPDIEAHLKDLSAESRSEILRIYNSPPSEESLRINENLGKFTIKGEIYPHLLRTEYLLGSFAQRLKHSQEHVRNELWNRGFQIGDLPLLDNMVEKGAEMRAALDRSKKQGTSMHKAQEKYLRILGGNPDHEFMSKAELKRYKREERNMSVAVRRQWAASFLQNLSKPSRRALVSYLYEVIAPDTLSTRQIFISDEYVQAYYKILGKMNGVKPEIK